MSANRSHNDRSTTREMMLRHLRELERQRALTQRQIDDEYRRIADLQRNRLESSMATNLLQALLTAQRSYENEPDSTLETLQRSLSTFDGHIFRLEMSFERSIGSERKQTAMTKPLEEQSDEELRGALAKG